LGYTHYWYKVRELKQDSFDDFVRDFITILPNFRNVLEQNEGNDQALAINNQLVIFNGIQENSHETFYFDRVTRKGSYEQTNDSGKIFNFTKTARKPYDIAVCSALIIAKQHFGDSIEISSDGDNEEWTEAKILCQKVLGYGAYLNMGDYSKNLEATNEFKVITN